MIFGDFFTETMRVFASIFPAKNALENHLKKARKQAVFLY
jgi:hypothetical protein